MDVRERPRLGSVVFVVTLALCVTIVFAVVVDVASSAHGFHSDHVKSLGLALLVLLLIATGRALAVWRGDVRAATAREDAEVAPAIAT